MIAGAVYLLETEWDKPLIRLPCAHHVDERYYGAAVGATFGEKTDSPSQTECLRFKKWYEENQAAIPKVIQYDPANPLIPYNSHFLRRCRQDLEALKARLNKDAHLHLPRGDYVHLWELVQVICRSSFFPYGHKRLLSVEHLLPSLISFFFCALLQTNP